MSDSLRLRDFCGLVAPEDGVFKEAQVVRCRIIKREMEASAFVTRERAIDDQAGDGTKIPQFEKVCGELEIPIKFLDFTL
jgi:hypothetical protein